MIWTTNSCFVTLVILFLWRVEEMAEACSCSPAHPQQAFCNSDVGKSMNCVKMTEFRKELNHGFLEKNKKKWCGGFESVKAERENLPNSYVYNYRGRRMEFSVSQSFFPLPSSLFFSPFSPIICWYSSVLIVTEAYFMYFTARFIISFGTAWPTFRIAVKLEQ